MFHVHYLTYFSIRYGIEQYYGRTRKLNWLRSNPVDGVWDGKWCSGGADAFVYNKICQDKDIYSKVTTTVSEHPRRTLLAIYDGIDRVGISEAVLRMQGIIGQKDLPPVMDRIK